jgi:hypothetical protein
MALFLFIYQWLSGRYIGGKMTGQKVGKTWRNTHEYAPLPSKNHYY